MLWFPDEPLVPPQQTATATAWVRYEDVAQDGRITVIGLPPLTGPSVWATLLTHHPVLRTESHTGVVPILSRIIVEGLGGPVSVGKPLSVTGSYQLAHTLDEKGLVNRIVLNTWLTAVGQRGRTHGPPPPGAGEPIAVGRVYGESVFTRPFGPPSARKVLRFDIAGQEPIPPDRHHWRTPDSNLDLPPGAVSLDDELIDDEVAIHFGLCHTDSNQHVNSLVYPRLFEEAALRRFARLHHSTRMLARFFDIAYRKPCFAGDRVRIRLRAFSLTDSSGHHLGAVGTYVSDGATGDAARPHCYICMVFSE